MLRTRLCDLLGIEVPIIAAPMGWVTGPELAAAVSNAGGLGIMSFSLNPPPALREDIRRLRRLTEKPFGVNLVLAFPQDENIESMDLLAGQSVGLVRELKPAATIVRELVDGAREIIGQRLTRAIGETW